MRFRMNRKGFTLVEVIVSLAIMAIVSGSVAAFIIAGNNSYIRGNRELTLQEEAQLAANQIIDLIIDVEKGITYSGGLYGDAVDIDGNVTASAVPVSELRLYNEDNVYMLRFQGGTGYPDANQVYLYEAENTWVDADNNPVTKDTEGAKLVIADPAGSKGALMAQYVTEFSVDLSELDSRKVILNMKFGYEDRDYEISETIRLRNSVTDKPSEMYPQGEAVYNWIDTIEINPTHADMAPNKEQKFTYKMTGDPEAVAQGVNWKVERVGGSLAAGTHLSVDSEGNAILHVGSEALGDDVLIVTCTSAAVPSMSAQATVSIVEAGIENLSISPKDASVIQGKNLQFTASATQNGVSITPDVDWTVVGVYADTANNTLKPGTGIDSNGLLTADIEQPIGQRVLKVRATLKADSTKFDETYVTVNPKTNIDGKYDAKLIARNLTTYTLPDGETGYTAEIECLPTWADYLNGYPIIKWYETTNPGAYSFGNMEDGDETQFTNTLYCGTQKDTMAHVQAEVQLDADTFVSVGIDISIPDIIPTSKADIDKPYIDSDNFVLYRNGQISCTLLNYDKNDEVVWKFKELPADLTYTVTGADNISYTSDLVGFDLVEGTYDGINNTRFITSESAGVASGDKNTVTVRAKYLVDWNKEYRLKLIAVNKNTNEQIAESIVLVPKFDILFTNGSHYETVKRPVWYSRFFVQLYGFATGQSDLDASGGTSGGNFRTQLETGAIQAEKIISSGTQVVDASTAGEGDYVALNISWDEENDMLILPIWDKRRPDAVRYLMFIVDKS